MTITTLESNHISEISKILNDRSIETFGYSPQNCEPESLYNNEFQEVTTVVVIDVSLPASEYHTFTRRLHGHLKESQSHSLYIFVPPAGRGDFVDYILSIDFEAETELFEIGQLEEALSDTDFKEKTPTHAEHTEAHEIIDELSNQLIDMSRNNKLLNYTSNKASIRIINESPNGLFKVLVDKTKSMTLEPFWEEPSDVAETKSEQDSESAEETKAPKLDLYLDYSDETTQEHFDEKIQTSHPPDNLQSISLKAYTKAQRIIKTTGTNQLYLAIGFLRWYESIESETITRSPLLLIPLNMTREKKMVKEPILPQDSDYDQDYPNRTRRAQRFVYTVSYSGDEIVPNNALRIRLEQGFDSALPVNMQGQAEGEFSPEEYLAEISQWVAGFHEDQRWRVDRHAAIGFFDFSRVWMHEDLCDKAWKSQNCDALEIIFGGREVAGPMVISDSDIERSERDYDIPLVCPADTSQYKVIMRAMGQESLVVEGPPGTGKSQTIANIIGALLNKGQKILFLSAKETALAVVQKRLDDAGLGHLLLSMHADGQSGGSNAIEIATSIEDRQKVMNGQSGVSDSKLKELDMNAAHLREYLNDAAEKLATLDPDTHKNLSTLMWEANQAWEKYQRECKTLNLNPEELTINDEILDKGLHIAIQEARDFQLHIKDLEEDGVLKPNSEWQGVILDAVDKQVTEQIIEVAQRLYESWESFESITCPAVEADKQSSPKFLLSLFANLVEAKFPEWRLGRIGSELNILEDPAQAIQSIQELLDEISKHDRLSETLEIQPERLPSIERIEDVINKREELVAEHPTWRNAGDQMSLDDIRLRLSKIADIVEAIWKDEGLLSCTPVDDIDRISVSNMRSWLTLLREIASPEGVQWKSLSPALAKAEATEVMNKVRKSIEEARETRMFIEDKIDLSCFPNEDDLVRIKKSLRNDGLWARYFGEHKKAMTEVRDFLHAKPNNASEVMKLFSCYQRLLDLEESIHDHGQAKELFGSLFDGLDTDWHRIETAIEKVATLVNIAGIRRLPEILSQDTPHASSDLLEDAIAAFDDLKLLIEENVQLTDYKLTHLSAMHWGDLVEALKNAIEDIDPIIAWYDSISWEPWRQHPFGQIFSTLAAALQFAKLIDTIPTHASRDYLGSLFKGPNTSPELANEIIVAAQSLDRALTGLEDEDPLKKYLENETWSTAFNLLNSWTSSCASYVVEIAAAESELKATGTISPGDPFVPSEYTKSLRDWRAIINQRVSNPQGLHQWYDLTTKLEHGKQFGLGVILEWILTGRAPVSIINSSFAASLRRSYVNRFCERRSIDIESLQDSRLSRRRAEFHKADEARLKVFPKQIVSKHANPEIPNEGPSGNRIADKRGMHLIRHAIGKTRTTITVRDLMDRSFQTIQALKPCWLMSPGSVSQYLSRTNELFDILIVDEASQIRTSEIAGSALRSKRMLIFGDTNQMPPSAIGRRNINSEDADYELGESVLDQAAKSMPKVRLEWHYRSQHEDLIRYSNKYFYEDSLVVFPSRKQKDDELGIRYRHVGGFFVGRRNQIEADAAASEFKRHLLSQAHKPAEERSTVGIVTMNSEQRDFIEKLVDDLASEDSIFNTVLEESRSSASPCFITNLENVQGDERDHIIISFTYGPEAEGLKTNNRFGPVSHPGGERRLNVLFTRSRMKMTVLTSMHSNEITSNTKGARHMRGFLEFAKSGTLYDQGDNSSGEAENIFEETVGRALTDAGYKISYQVGVKGYRIDIAIHDPNSQGNYIMAIECDGAAYHSSKTARERDRLRQEILEHSGWHFFRVWSTDWFYDKKKTVRRLLAAVGERVESVRKQEEREIQRAEELRIEYENTEHKNDLPVVFESDVDSKTKSQSTIDFTMSEAQVPAMTETVSTSKDAEIQKIVDEESIDTLFPHPSHSPETLVIAYIKKLVSKFGPLNALHAMRIYSKRSGNKKMGKIIHAKLASAFERALKNEDILSSSDTTASPLVEKIVKVHGQPDFQIRPDFDRDLDDIPDNELIAVMHKLEKEHPEGEQLNRAVLDVYGKKRLTDKAIQRLQSLRSNDPS